MIEGPNRNDVPEQPRSTWRQVGSAFEWLGSRRNGFLVGLAVIYGLGYLVWAVNSWMNNLGFLPALDFQYFVAIFTQLVLQVYIRR